MKLKEEIRSVLKGREEVSVAYLYGSIARGDARKDSDVDIGIFLKEDYEPDPLYPARLARKIEGNMTSGREVDVRVLNGASVVFLHQVLKYGEKVYVGDETVRIEFEARVTDQYLDFKPFLEEYNRIRRKRILQWSSKGPSSD